MAKLIVLIILVLCPIRASAWVCLQSNGYKSSDDTIYLCSTGIDEDETRAKILSLRNAEREFKEICSMNYDCRNNEIKVTPHRMDCKLDNGKFSCLRMIEFYITKRKKELMSSYEVEPQTENESSIEWNKLIQGDKTNYTLSIGYVYLTNTFKDYSDLSSFGLGLYVSKRVFKNIAIEIGAIWGDNGPNGQTYTDHHNIWSYYGYNAGIPLYYSWKKNEIHIKPTFNYISSDIEQKFSKAPNQDKRYKNQKQTGYGLEVGHNTLFYFGKKDDFYIGLNPRVSVIRYNSPNELTPATANYQIYFGITFGFR